MTHYLAALEQARRAFENRDQFDKQTKIDFVTALIEWGVFSDRQIAAIVGIRPQDVHELSKKTDHTGGAFTPEAIPLIIDVIHRTARDEANARAIALAIDAGVSTRMLAKLTGIAQRTVSRRANDGRALLALDAEE